MVRFYLLCWTSAMLHWTHPWSSIHSVLQHQPAGKAKYSKMLLLNDSHFTYCKLFYILLHVLVSLFCHILIKMYPWGKEPFYWQQVLSWATCASLPGFIRYHFVNSYPLALKQLEALYIGRTYHAWKEPEVKNRTLLSKDRGTWIRITFSPS